MTLSYRVRNALFCYMLLASTVAHAQNSAPEKHPITVRGQSYNMLPFDYLRERGIRVPEIAAENNAAFRYFDAVNAYVAPDQAPEDWVDKAARGEWPDDPETEAQLVAYLDANAEALSITREATRMDDYFLPLFGEEGEPLYTFLLPSLAPQRQLAKLLAADAQRQIRAGNHELGMDRLLTAQRMGNHLGNGSTMIEGLVGVAVNALVSDQLTHLANTYDIPTDVLIDTTTAMNDIAVDLPSFEDMLRAEEALTDDLVDDVLVDPTIDQSMIGMPMPPSMLKPQKGSGWHQLVKELRRVYLPDRAIKRHAKKYYEKVREGTRPKKDGTPGTILQEDLLLADVPAWDVLTLSTLPSFSRAHEIVLMSKSNFERARVRLAVRAYEQDRGQLPPNLQALTPTYLARVPADPMTGYDFEYQPSTTEGGVPTGLSKVTRENAEELKRKRRTPAILTPRASKWRRYVMRFADRYELDDRQRASADGILRDIESRAAAFERTQGAKIQQLIDEGDQTSAKAEMKPLDKLFDEMERRLKKLPTRKQRAAVEQEANEEGK